MRKIINSATAKYEDELTDNLVLDAVPTVNSFNSVTSDAVARAIAGASGEVPVVEQENNGQFLKAIYDEGGPAVSWADAPDELPPTTGHQQGDVLTIGETGIDWATPAGGGGVSPTQMGTAMASGTSGAASVSANFNFGQATTLPAGLYLVSTNISDYGSYTDGMFYFELGYTDYADSNNYYIVANSVSYSAPGTVGDPTAHNQTMVCFREPLNLQNCTLTVKVTPADGGSSRKISLNSFIYAL